jgi:hypothetical protein
MNATKEIIEAVNKLPFIELPVDDLAAVEALQQQGEVMRTRIDELRVNIGEFRSRASENLSKITTAISGVNSELAELRSDLARADTGLSQIQTRVDELQEQLPMFLVIAAIILTLLTIWVGYSQIVVIGRARQHLRDIRSLEAAEKHDDTDESGKAEMEPTTNEEAVSGEVP